MELKRSNPVTRGVRMGKDSRGAYCVMEREEGGGGGGGGRAVRAARAPSNKKEGRGVKGSPTVRAEPVAGAMEEDSRRRCSRVWCAEKNRRRRDGGEDGGGN